MSDATKPSESGWIALQVVMMPRDANPLPTMLPGNTQNTTFATIVRWYNAIRGYNTKRLKTQ